jgi:hypothetical protein
MIGIWLRENINNYYLAGLVEQIMFFTLLVLMPFLLYKIIKLVFFEEKELSESINNK